MPPHAEVLSTGSASRSADPALREEGVARAQEAPLDDLIGCHDDLANLEADGPDDALRKSAGTARVRLALEYGQADDPGVAHPVEEWVDIRAAGTSAELTGTVELFADRPHYGRLVSVVQVDGAR